MSDYRKIDMRPQPLTSREILEVLVANHPKLLTDFQNVDADVVSDLAGLLQTRWVNTETRPGVDTTDGGDVYPIGTKFKTRHKHPKLCTVVNILRTYNVEGHLVKIRYVATHEFCGQTVADNDVVAATIAMGLITD